MMTHIHLLHWSRLPERTCGITYSGVEDSQNSDDTATKQKQRKATTKKTPEQLSHTVTGSTQNNNKSTSTDSEK